MSKARNKAPALPESKLSIPVEKFGRRQRINVAVIKSDRQIKKEKTEMKKAKIVNQLKKAIFYVTQSSLILGGITLLCMAQVKFSMAAPVSFMVSIPIYQFVGVILLGIFIYTEITARRSKKTADTVA